MTDIFTEEDFLAEDARNGVSMEPDDNGQGIIGDSVDALQHGVYKGIEVIAETFGADDLDAWASRQSEKQLYEMSQAGRDGMQKSIFTRDEHGELTFGEGATDARAITLQVAMMIGMNADILVGGAAVIGARLAVT